MNLLQTSRRAAALSTALWLAAAGAHGAGKPLRLDPGRRVLFLDDAAVAERDRVERRFHAPRPAAPGPVVAGAFRGFVHPDPAGGYRLYYTAGPVRSGTDEFFAVRMARSPDGLVWELPDLNLTEVDPEFEEERNNVLVQDALLLGLFFGAGGDAAWKAVFLDLGRASAGKSSNGLPAQASGPEAVFTSRDGIHWIHAADSEGPVRAITGACGGSPIAWVQGLGRYVRFDPAPAGGGGLVRRESQDLVHWREVPASVTGAPGAPVRLTAFEYQGNWLAWLETADPGGTGRVHLAASRDGLDWSVVVRDFLPAAGPGDAHPCRTGLTGMATAGGPVPGGDDLRIYRVRSLVPQPATARDFGTEAFALRRDGFAALEAGASPGRIVTRPLTLGGGAALYVNAEIDPAGSVTASVLGPDGREIGGFEESRCVPLRAGGLASRLDWSGAGTTAALAGRPVQVAFRLTQARLYSFWIE